MLELLVAGLGVSLSLAWLGLLVRALRHRRDPHRLADLPTGDPPFARTREAEPVGAAPAWPSLAVVIAARNEADEIEAAMESLLAQDYPGLRVVAVNDRSTDATGAVLDRLAARDARLRVVHIGQLPAGWLGKTHALQVGSRAAESQWIAFTDGDVVFAPGTLRRAVRHAVEEGVDHVTVGPDVRPETFGERLFLAFPTLLFLVMIYTPLGRVDDPRSRAFAGAGAFNLVRRRALDAIGGFDRIALSVEDDLRLGQALKYSGSRSLVLSGLGAIMLRWHRGLPRMLRALDKNFFSAVDYRPGRAVLALLVMLVIAGAAHAGLLAGPAWTRGICAAGVAAIAGLFLLAGPHRRVAPGFALLLPVSGLLLGWTLFRSVVQTYRWGGVRWRDRLYPLPELRAHVRERNRWLRESWKRNRTAARGRRV